MKDYPLDGNKEMVAMGTMNIIGSLTSCYVATGALKQSKKAKHSLQSNSNPLLFQIYIVSPKVHL